MEKKGCGVENLAGTYCHTSLQKQNIVHNRKCGSEKNCMWWERICVSALAHNYFFVLASIFCP
jgi:hypothetical protein